MRFISISIHSSKIRLLFCRLVSIASVQLTQEERKALLLPIATVNRTLTLHTILINQTKVHCLQNFRDFCPAAYTRTCDSGQLRFQISAKVLHQTLAPGIRAFIQTEALGNTSSCASHFGTTCPPPSTSIAMSSGTLRSAQAALPNT